MLTCTLSPDFVGANTTGLVSRDIGLPFADIRNMLSPGFNFLPACPVLTAGVCGSLEFNENILGRKLFF